MTRVTRSGIDLDELRNIREAQEALDKAAEATVEVDARTPRAADSREVWSYAPASTLPDAPESPDWDHRWVRATVVGAQDLTNTSAHARQGWEVVSPKDPFYAQAPSLQHIAHNRNDSSPDHFEIGGLILMRIKKSRADARREYYDRMNSGLVEAELQRFGQGQRSIKNNPYLAEATLRRIAQP